MPNMSQVCFPAAAFQIPLAGRPGSFPRKLRSRRQVHPAFPRRNHDIVVDDAWLRKVEQVTMVVSQAAVEWDSHAKAGCGL